MASLRVELNSYLQVWSDDCVSLGDSSAASWQLVVWGTGVWKWRRKRTTSAAAERTSRRNKKGN